MYIGGARKCTGCLAGTAAAVQDSRALADDQQSATNSFGGDPVFESFLVKRFFDEAMPEHRANAYENFIVPKTEKWDRIQELLQGLPGRNKKVDESGEADRMIQHWNLRVEEEPTAGTGVPNFVLISAKTVGEWQEIFDETYKAPYWLNVNTGAITLEKPPALCRRRRYIHQGEVCAVLMAFLREQPTLKNSTLRLEHAGTSYQDIQGKVEAKYCNITDEVIKDLFRALDLCYYLFDIPLKVTRI